MLGRVLNADEKKLSFMLVGNNVVTVQRNDIAQLETEKKSLMFEGLVSRITSQQRDALLDYLESLR